MNFANLTAGKSIPDEINVIIEIAANAEPVKYEVDKESGMMCVDRFLSTAMQYPCNYGYVPQTLSDDGDPVDVLVVAPHSLVVGSVIACRPIGMLRMEDEAGQDAKVLAVPISKLTKLYEHIQRPEDLPQGKLDMIAHFFAHYKDLEANKWVKIAGWDGPEAARQEILASCERYTG
jgi:inorganic pyrophosphatase